MKNILVTGGAGFIGSNLVDALMEAEQIGLVRVLDDLSTGFLENISRHLGNPKFEFLQGDIRDFRTCQQACEGMHWVSPTPRWVRFHAPWRTPSLPMR